MQGDAESPAATVGISNSITNILYQCICTKRSPSCGTCVLSVLHTPHPLALYSIAKKPLFRVVHQYIIALEQPAYACSGILLWQCGYYAYQVYEQQMQVVMHCKKGNVHRSECRCVCVCVCVCALYFDEVDPCAALGWTSHSAQVC